MPTFRELVESHPLPWFIASIVAAFVSGVGAYQGVLTWSGMKVVRDEASARLPIRIETTPADAQVALAGEKGKFFQGMPLPDGASEFSIEREGYRPQTLRLAKNGGALVLSVPMSRVPSIVKTGSLAYSKDLLSLNFQSIEVRALFDVLADFIKARDGAVNFVLGPTVKGTVSVRLKDVPWDLAVEIAVARAGLDMRRTGNVFLIDVP